MSHRVQVATGVGRVDLPDGNVYTAGQTATLTDAQFGLLAAGLFPATLIDLGYMDDRGQAGLSPSQVALAGSPTGVYRPNMSRIDIASDLVGALTTQVMTAVALYLQAGDVVTNLTFKSGATAASVPTNWWFALYDRAATPAKLAQTADQLTAAWAANAAKTVALAAPYTVLATGIYYAAIMVKATTVPTLIGSTLFVGGTGGVLTADKTLAQTSGSALTTTAPTTIATPTSIGVIPYVVAT